MYRYSKSWTILEWLIYEQVSPFQFVTPGFVFFLRLSKIKFVFRYRAGKIYELNINNLLTKFIHFPVT